MHSHTHNHNHAHTHGPVDLKSVNSAFIIGIILNIAYIIAEVIAGLYVPSMALLSDAGHNLGDVAGLGLSLLAFRMAKMQPTHSFTYGYKKTTILAALANAVILLIGIGILGVESFRRIFHPAPVEGGVVALVSGIGIVVNGVSALLFFRNKEHDLNTKGAYLHLMMDALVSFAVVIAGLVIKYTGWYWLDPVISLGVLLVVLVSTWSLLTGSLRLSLDAVPAEISIDEIVSLIKNNAGVENVHHTHIWAMSTTENALTTHVVMSDDLPLENKMQMINDIKHELLHHNIQHATIELETADMHCLYENC